MDPDIITLFNACADLPGVDEQPDELPEFLYGHIAQCIISAVYSIDNSAASELKTVARYTHCAVILHAFGVQYLQDVALVMDDEEFEASIRGIPGQRDPYHSWHFCLAFDAPPKIRMHNQR